ncbi:hypothetical protein F53441_6510 [Fusarium austroafricanum]|uniref:N-acetyltransferase domain-containing protein n=1 Tax=Fusarium austroafricanum TaxID=2364996 RepID=A0A8H4KIG6_9HYPO|nr:hypothetical protein F53441_6510 [Fusarium austroafricanum]
MDYTTHDIVNAFKSDRLEYVRIDKCNEDMKKLALAMQDDPIIQVMAAPTVLQPKGQKDLDSYLESLSSALLGVAISLREEQDSTLEDKGDENDKKKSRTFIGILCIGWGGISPAVAHHRNAEMGITLLKDYQSKGYGREAINWMLDWGFRHAGLHTIGITCADYNPRALHLYENIGFTVEGRRRATIWQNRKWYDLVEMGMTEDEWEVLRGLEKTKN